MRKLVLATLAMGLMATQAAADFKRIKTEAEFREKIVGHKYAVGKDYSMSKKNGQMTGRFGGKKLVGAWNWQKGYWCRTIKLGGKDRGSDCQVVMASDNQMYVIRKQGKGDKSPVYTRK